MMQAKAQNLLYYMEGVQGNNDGSYHILGLPPNLLSYNIDGAAVKQSVRSDIGTTTTAITPPVDAIAEAQVWSTGIPAEMGHNGGGAFQLVLKSGTNELHFSAEERYINKDWLHRAYFQQVRQDLPFEYHNFVATLGGPVVIPKLYNGRNKTFFFLAYSLNYDHEQNPAIASTPDPAMLGGNFSFGGLGLPIYDPKTITCTAAAGCANGTGYTATPFSGQQIPLSRFDPVAAKFLSLQPYKLPNIDGFYSNTGPNNNYSQNSHYLSDREGYIVKIDQQLASNHKFFFRFAWNMNRQFGREAVQYRLGLLDNTEFSFGQREPIDLHNVTFGDVYTFSPTLINEFRVAYMRRNDTIQPALNNQGWAASSAFRASVRRPFPDLSAPRAVVRSPGLPIPAALTVPPEICRPSTRTSNWRERHQGGWPSHLQVGLPDAAHSRERHRGIAALRQCIISPPREAGCRILPIPATPSRPSCSVRFHRPPSPPFWRTTCRAGGLISYLSRTTGEPPTT